MNRRIAALALAATVALAGPAAAQSDTEFTYQGRLDFQGQPYTGSADYRFTLWNAATGGSQIGDEHPLDGADVEGGLFAAAIDFGADAFAGQRWLEIAVRTPAWDGQGAEPPFTTLDPRQAITRSPYSIQTRGIFVDDDERVGIGTIVVQDFTAATIRGRGVNSDYIQFQSTSLENQWHLSGTNFGLDFVETGVAANRLFLAPGGNVGIGTNNPQSRLHLASGELRFPDGSRLARSPIVASVRSIEIQFGAIAGGGRTAGGGPISGAQPGDIVLINVQGDTPNPFVLHGAHVPSPDQIRFLFSNLGDSTVDPPTFFIDVLVLRP